MPVQPQDIEISVVMPCLNEAETLGACIREALSGIEAAGVAGEIVVADNGSSDGSPALAARLGARVVTVPEKGYGHALQGGIAAARGAFVLMGDADGSYDFSALPRLLAPLQRGADLVMGCRFPRCGGRVEPGAMPWKHRWIGNPGLSRVGKLFFSAPVDDFHCGLRAFKREAIIALGLRTGGMEFASEMVVKATLCRLHITQVPITLRRDGRSRPPHLRSWRDGWRHLRFMLLYSPNWLFMIPGLILAVLGAVGFLVLLPGPLLVPGGVTLDLNTLLVATMAMLVGTQILGFGLFAKAYAATEGLLPGAEGWLRVLKGRPVEWGILAGLVLVLAGLGDLGYATWVWQAAGFGPLSYQESLRMVIPAVTGIALGAQAMFFGFALGILGLEK